MPDDSKRTTNWLRFWWPEAICPLLLALAFYGSAALTATILCHFWIGTP